MNMMTCELPFYHILPMFTLLPNQHVGGDSVVIAIVATVTSRWYEMLGKN